MMSVYHVIADRENRRGTRADFQVLKDAGIELKRKIALADYGGIYRGKKVKNAQDNGMIEAVLYTDLLDDGEVREENGHEGYPSMSSACVSMLELIILSDGPAINPSSIQRGSVMFSSLYSSNPTTVGWASSNDSAHGNISLYTSSIPSISLSMKDAVLLLRELAGHGVSAKEANCSGWVRKFEKVTYDSGRAPGAKINIDHLMHNYIAPVWDVIGVIHGICSCMLTLRLASLGLGMLTSSGFRA
jgi:N-acetylated-alpha-linked acidic dipeptidase